VAQKNVLKPESNVQFGEGGAGTFSDGKLYSQIKDPRFLGRKVMDEFVKAGAPPEILYEPTRTSAPSSWSRWWKASANKSSPWAAKCALNNACVDLLLKTELVRNAYKGWRYKTPMMAALGELSASHVVMALGHSARDTFAMLHQRGVAMQAKPFSVGFRIEHPQSVIDRARWGRHAGHPMLGAADYKLVHHAANGRSVYSFCMCPGGTVVAATSEPGRVVTNGMSQYSRNERNANAGIVVGIEPKRLSARRSQLCAGLWPGGRSAFAREAAALAAASTHRAALPPARTRWPALRCSARWNLGPTCWAAAATKHRDNWWATLSPHGPPPPWAAVQPSYKPGVKLGDLAPSLPDYAINAIREALPVFGKKIKGFDMADAVLTGVETRTSSPLKIPRGENLQSTNISGLYPAGEGASYAGGILSAAVDGIKVAEAVARSMLSVGHTA
jgi:uncharacterized FAD-dependent dehydrogenase